MRRAGGGELQGGRGAECGGLQGPQLCRLELVSLELLPVGQQLLSLQL